MKARPIEFIVCDESGCWHNSILEVPSSIENEKATDWALEQHFNHLDGIVYVGIFNEMPYGDDYYNEEEE